jgi:hypothetical protein
MLTEQVPYVGEHTIVMDQCAMVSSDNRNKCISSGFKLIPQRCMCDMGVLDQIEFVFVDKLLLPKLAQPHQGSRNSLGVTDLPAETLIVYHRAIKEVCCNLGQRGAPIYTTVYSATIGGT